MQGIKLEITKYIDNYYPGIIEGRFFDVNNIEHIIHEKVPVVTLLDLDENSSYPQKGMIACEIILERIAEDGSKMFEVDSTNPWGIETIQGNTRFEVFEDQLLFF